MLRIFALLAGTLLFSNPSFAQDDSASERGIILENIRDFSANLVNGNFEAVAEAYTTDGKLFPNGQEIISGKAGILNYWTPAPGKKSRTVYHKITPAEIKILGNEAYDWGYYEGSTRMEDGTQNDWRGKYVIVWKKQPDGQWKIYLDIWNRIND